MLDTIWPTTANKFLITRFLAPSFKEYAIIDSDKVILKNLQKASYNDFAYHCLNKNPQGIIKAILHAELNIGGKYELHQYVIWETAGGAIKAATFLSGNEDFKIKV